MEIGHEEEDDEGEDGHGAAEELAELLGFAVAFQIGGVLVGDGLFEGLDAGGEEVGIVFGFAGNGRLQEANLFLKLGDGGGGR